MGTFVTRLIAALPWLRHIVDTVVTVLQVLVSARVCVFVVQRVDILVR